MKQRGWGETEWSLQPRNPSPRLPARIGKARFWLPLAAALALYSTPTAATTLSSSQYPLWVDYDTDSDQALAQQVLIAAEQAWKRLIVELNYPTPYSLDSNGQTSIPGVRVRIANTGMGAGAALAEWDDDIPSTTQCDCSSHIVIDRATSATLESVAEGVFHEMVHATQYSADCTEPPSAYEGFAIAAVRYEFPGSAIAKGVLSKFQQFPEYPLDYWTMTMPCTSEEPCFAYQLGAGLFELFLTERYGNNDPAFLRELFAATAQSGTTTVGPPHPSCSEPNHPNWWEALDAVLVKRGASFKEAFSLFSEWRAVVGAQDDGQHFSSGQQIAEPAVGGSLQWPQTTSVQSSAREYGTRYLELLGLVDSQALWRVSLEADPAASWQGQVLLWTKGKPVSALPLTFQGAKGQAELHLSEDVERVLVAVTQLDDGSHDLDEMDYENDRQFTLRLESIGVDAAVEVSPESSVEAALEGMPEHAEAGSQPEAGPTPAQEPPEDSGCDCASARRDGTSSWAWTIALVVALTGRLRRPRRSAATARRT